MYNINWAQKLGSRKFWAMVAGLVMSACVLANADGETTQQVVALVVAFGNIAVYILAEAAVDKARY